jgi:hypothetical protein
MAAVAVGDHGANSQGIPKRSGGAPAPTGRCEVLRRAPCRQGRHDQIEPDVGETKERSAMIQILPHDMIETWKWMPQFDAWLFTLAKEGVEFKYERLIEHFSTRYEPKTMQFYYDDAIYAFKQQEGR